LTARSKRLIEVSLPLKAISAQSAREKSIRHGHISTLHIWWARRPLAAMRAAIFASLIPAPDPSTGLRAGTDEERERLEELIATTVDWDQVKDVTGLNIYNPRRQDFEFRPGPVLNTCSWSASRPRRPGVRRRRRPRRGAKRLEREAGRRRPHDSWGCSEIQRPFGFQKPEGSR